MTKLIKGVCLGLFAMSVMGCQKSSVTDEVDAKLDKIHRIAIPMPVPMNENHAPLTEDYHVANDPFVAPVGLTSFTASADMPQDEPKVVGVDDKSRSIEQPEENITKTSKPAIKYGKSVSVDLFRPRQVLESYALNSLIYRGRIEQSGQVSALVLSPDGVAHPVQVGHYLGQNHGRIAHIDRHEIILKEAIMQEDGRYYEQINRLRFHP